MEAKELAKKLEASIDSEIILWASACNKIDHDHDY
jgi:hypothetical protein